MTLIKGRTLFVTKTFIIVSIYNPPTTTIVSLKHKLWYNPKPGPLEITFLSVISSEINQKIMNCSAVLVILSSFIR